MKNPFKDNKALSQPVTTLILLVIPVMLSGGVAMYAYQIIGNELQMEVIVVSNQHVWIYDNGSSFAGFEVDNLGGRDSIIQKVEVRGVEVPWATVYYFKTPLIVTDLLNCPKLSEQSWTNYEYTPGTVANFTETLSDIPLPSGYTIVMVIENPDNIRVNDIGNSISLTVFTEHSQYQVLCNAQSA